jgi:hypothetical protein
LIAVNALADAVRHIHMKSQKEDTVGVSSPMTDIPPPPPATPIILFLLTALAGALLTEVGYVVHRAVWPGHDPVALLMSLWR